MASRSQVDVNERRLRPIYECLDSGYNKKAIQEVDKLLKKNKNFLCAKALKALALLRLGRNDESEVLLSDIHAQSPSDENVLHAMAICYKETYQWQCIADMYENAHKVRPDNEDVLSALFMAYVRLGDYKKQQQTAMLLHKLQPARNPYYFWAVMSIVMQARSADEKLSKVMFLPLAERMVLVYVNGGKITSEAEVQLYLIILEMMGKKEEMLAVVSGPLGDKLTSDRNGMLKHQAELHMELEQWPEANEKYKALLTSYADDWNHWQHYIKTALQLVQLKWQPNDSSDTDYSAVDNSVEKALSFIHERQTQAERPLRGPYLAELELMRVTTQPRSDHATHVQASDTNHSHTDHATGCLVELIVAYYNLFSDKPTCFSDLCPFIHNLSDCDKPEVVRLLYKSLKLKTDEGVLVYLDNVKDMQRHICALQLAQCCGCYDDMQLDERLAVSRSLYSRFTQGLELGGNLLKTNLQYSDDYLLLASHLLISAWRQTEDTKYLWDAVLYLERGRARSSYNSQFILLLMPLYSRLGVFGPCKELYESLEVKHVVHDTLGYIVFNHAARLGHFSTASTVYATMMSFFTVNHKEIPEYLIQAYKYGSFHKIKEFIALRTRLHNSLQYAQVSVAILMLELILETNSHKNTEHVVAHMEIDPNTDTIEWERLRDNRDLSVMCHWQPHNRLNMEEIQEKSFREEVSWLRLRSLSLRLMAACLRLPGSSHECCTNGVSHRHDSDDDESTTGESRPRVEVVYDLLTQFTRHVDTQCGQYSVASDYTLFGPFRTRLPTYLSSHHSRVFTLCIDLILYAHSLTDAPFKNIRESEEEKMKTIVTLLQELVEQCKSTPLHTTVDGRVTLQAHVIENYVQLMETISHAVLLTGVLHRILLPIKTSLSKQGKKKKTVSASMPATVEHYRDLCRGLEACTHGLHQQVKAVDPVLSGLSLSTLSLDPEYDDLSHQETWSEVWSKVEQSLQQSAGQIADVLHNKLHYITTLSL